MPKNTWSNKAIIVVLVLLASLMTRAQEPTFYPGGTRAIRFEQNSGYFHYVIPCRLLIREKYWTGLVAEGPGQPALCWPMNVLQIRRIDGKTQVSPLLQGMLQVSATELQFLPNQAKDANYYLLASAAASGAEHQPNNDMAFFFTGELGYRFGFTNFCVGCVAGTSPIDPGKKVQLEEEYSLVAQSLKQFNAVYERVRERASFLRVGVTPTNQPATNDIREAMDLYGALNQRLAEACPGTPSVCIRQYAKYQACAAAGKTAECGGVPTCSSQCTLSPKEAKDLKANVCSTEREDYATLTPDWSEVLKRRDGDLPPGPQVFQVHNAASDAPSNPAPGVMGVVGMGMMGGRNFYDGTGTGGTLSVVDCSPAYSYNLARGVYNRTAHPTILKGLALLDGPAAMANIVDQARAVYPPVAKAARVSGKVWLATTIGEDGKVSHLSAISGPEMLRGAAIDAVSQWRFKPYLENGVAVPVSTMLVVIFALER